jgi:hypothetical protein
LQKKAEETMSKKIERLKAYVESKAGFLKSFEFLDDDDFDLLLEAPCLIRIVTSISLFASF